MQKKCINKISLKNIFIYYIKFLYGRYHKNLILSEFFSNQIEFTIVQLISNTTLQSVKFFRDMVLQFYATVIIQPEIYGCLCCILSA